MVAIIHASTHLDLTAVVVNVASNPSISLSVKVFSNDNDIHD